ncbi:MAG TPA: amidohydrolase family protein [Candidatus Dormibacteraeota bacterium]|nr:amidohydrolase family protein [Candidatus Dormibacteraeota bacterium]
MSAESAPPLLLRHVTVIDATGAQPRQDQRVRIERGRIVSVEPDTGPVPAHALIVNGTGKFLIPGLWDMHVHLAFENWEPFIQPVFFPMLLANGVTGVRDMAGDMSLLLKLRRQIDDGEILGPRLVIAGRELSWLPQDTGQFAVLNAAQARHLVDQLVAAHVNFIKVQDPLSREVYFAVADQARRRRIPFAGHVPYSVTASEASSAGQKSFEHLIGIPEACSTQERELKHSESAAMVRLDPDQHEAAKFFFAAFDSYKPENAAKLFAQLKKRSTWQVPTLVEERSSWTLSGTHRLTDERMRYIPEVTLRWWDSYMNDLAGKRTAEDLASGKKFFDRELVLFRDMHRAGVKFLAGTDAIAMAYVFPGSSLHEELELMVQAGLTPMEALQTATRNPAEYLGVLQDRGTVEAGKVADLVLLNANPLDSIGNTRKIEAVILRGRLFRRHELDAMLSSAAARARESGIN